MLLVWTKKRKTALLVTAMTMVSMSRKRLSVAHRPELWITYEEQQV
jgi:hypothetical protein